MGQKIPDYDPSDPWRTATFEGAEIETLRTGAAWTSIERLQWLEQMTRFAIETQKRNFQNLPQGHPVRIYMEAHPEESSSEKTLASPGQPPYPDPS